MDHAPLQPLPVWHHVYSSVSGYRTLHRSARLAAEQLGRLERHAKLWCDAGTDRPATVSMALDEAHWSFARVFRAGVDRAGRPRLAVHTLVVPTASLARDWPQFNPGRPPEALFLTPDDSLDKLDDRQFAPTLEPASGGTDATISVDVDRPFEEAELALALQFIYARHGVVWLEGEGVGDAAQTVPEPLLRLLDWLPLVYRVKWSVGTFPLTPANAPCQIVLGTTAPNDDRPVLSRGFPPALVSPTPKGGLWNALLGDGDRRQRSEVRRFVQWFHSLPMSEAPSPAQESWMLFAFRALSPVLPYQKFVSRLGAGDVAQLVFGWLALGWAGQTVAAVEAYSAFAEACLKTRHLLPVAIATDLFFRALEAGGRGAGAAQVQAAVVEVLLTELPPIDPRRRTRHQIGFDPAAALPVPHPAAPIDPWGAKPTSVLFINGLELAAEAIMDLAQHETLLEEPETRLAAALLLGSIARARAHPEIVAPEHQWIFTETLAARTGRYLWRVLTTLRERYRMPHESLALAERVLGRERREHISDRYRRPSEPHKPPPPSRSR